MRLEGKVVNALVMAKKAVQGIKDPDKTFYSIGIVKDEELGELSCTKEVYDSVEKMNYYDFGFCYNQQYKSLQLDSILVHHGSLFPASVTDVSAAPAEQIEAVPETVAAEEKEEKKEEASATVAVEEKKEEASTTTKSSKK